jgi:hypothetical protein
MPSRSNQENKRQRYATVGERMRGSPEKVDEDLDEEITKQNAYMKDQKRWQGQKDTLGFLFSRSSL